MLGFKHVPEGAAGPASPEGGEKHERKLRSLDAGCCSVKQFLTTPASMFECKSSSLHELRTPKRGICRFYTEELPLP